jgi:hypothetical protein
VVPDFFIFIDLFYSGLEFFIAPCICPNVSNNIELMVPSSCSFDYIFTELVVLSSSMGTSFFEALPITIDRTVSPEMSSPNTSDFVVMLLVVFSRLDLVVLSRVILCESF